MGEMSDLRVIYLVHPSKGVPAPECPVVYACSECGGEVELDAYQGPPVCQIHRKVLTPLRIVRPPLSAAAPARGGFTQPQETARDKGALDRTHTDELDARFGEQTPT